MVNVKDFLKVSSLAERTKRLYSFFLDSFFAWLSVAHPGTDPEDVTASLVIDWFGLHPAWGSSSRNSAAAALREFYRFAYGQGHQVVSIKTRRIEAGPQRTLDREELAAIMAAIPSHSPKGVRDLAIVTLMADTGLRAAEVCSIELRNLEPKKNRLVVLTKGSIWSEKFYFDYTAQCLAEWLALRPDQADPGCKFLFISMGGKKQGGPLTPSGLRYLYEELAKATGQENITPHVMRRTFATLAIEEGAPTRLVQKAGGWKSLRMVEHYSEALSVRSMNRYSPVNGIMGVKEPS